MLKKILVIEKITEEQFVTLKAVITAMGIDFIEPGNSGSETASPKAKKTTTKQTSKKSDDNFDRAKYEATAKQLGCFGKHGVWKCCRPTVYAVMNGEMTVAKGKTEVKAVIKKNGWDK